MPAVTRIPQQVEHTSDRQTNQLQANANRTAQVVNACPFMQGAVLAYPDANGNRSEDIAFTAGQTLTVAHKLVRKPLGFIVIGAFGGTPALKWDPSASDDRTISLTSVNACTYRVWVY